MEMLCSLCINGCPRRLRVRVSRVYRLRRRRTPYLSIYAVGTPDTSGVVECVNPRQSALVHKELEHRPASRGQETKFFGRYACILYRSDGVAAIQNAGI